MLACAAQAQDHPGSGASSEDPQSAEPAWRGRAQVRRENVNRGTSEETTKTFVRWDNFVWGGMLSFQVAFPDEQTDFNGSAFDPRLGDSKTRFRFAAFPAGAFTLSYFLEATFPTADPAELGAGKYQLSGGVTAVRQARVRSVAQLQQVNSVGGDEARADINYTKLDLSLRDTFGPNWIKAALNTRADWELGRTGAVGELEYGRRLDRHWSLWLLGGHLLWGEGVKATYGSKVMIGLERWY